MGIQVKFAGVLLVATGLHAAARAQSHGAEPMLPSELVVGDTVPIVVTHECEVFVAFRSSCRFCAEAAETERLGDPGHTTWVGAPDDLGVERFRHLVHPSSKVVVSDSLFALMQVRAVPLAVILDRQSVVIGVGRYRGDEGEVCGLQGAPTGGALLPEMSLKRASVTEAAVPGMFY